MVYYELNDELDGIELYFEGEFPSKELRDEMKSVRLRWNRNKKCWYTKQWNEEGVEFIKNYCDEKIDKPTTINFESMLKKRCCYADTIANFEKEEENGFKEKIISNFKEEHRLDLSDEQIHAWIDSFRVMKKLSLNPNINIIFEYVLPYEGGRRPDVILLSKEFVVILEFKMKDRIKEEDLDQVSAYARDLREYHYETRDKKVIPILVLTRTTNLNEKINNVTCISDDMLQDTLDDIYSENINPTPLDIWISSKYEPLPTIVDAARTFMKHEELPNIRRVNSTCIPETLKNLKKLTDYARENKKHTIAFVTGVPGSGKTYLGLQYVYEIEKVNSVYLSGNGPLVDVLTDALKSRVFVKSLHKVLDEFLRSGAYDFKSNIIVFDEGQRAWDNEQMKKKNKGDLSEPKVMIKLCEERLDWCVLLILVGEGQEIHNGENSGIKLWNKALNNGLEDWEIICPPNLYSYFEDEPIIDEIDNSSFNLTISLRSHLSGTVSKFVNYFIDGDIENASRLTDSIYEEGYDMYCTRDLETAKSYCRNRYEEEPNKKYGLIASSRSKILPKYGMNNTFNATRVKYGKWFNAPSEDPKSCCALNKVVTEFGVQGLELDMPIIGWEYDMIWKGDEWKKFIENQDENSEKNTYRRNTYRVLLTRGRDGFIVFVPNDSKLDPVYEILKEVGVKELN